MQHYPNLVAAVRHVRGIQNDGRRTKDEGCGMKDPALVTVTSVKMIVDSRVRICGLILAYFVTCRHSCSDQKSQGSDPQPDADTTENGN